MMWNDLNGVRIPFEATILERVLRFPRGEEWMVGRRCTVVEVYRSDSTPMTLCELDYGLDIGVKLISLPLEYLDRVVVRVPRADVPMAIPPEEVGERPSYYQHDAITKTQVSHPGYKHTRLGKAPAPAPTPPPALTIDDLELPTP